MLLQPVQQCPGQPFRAQHLSPRGLDPPLGRLPFALQHLGLCQTQQEPLKVDFLLGALLSRLGVSEIRKAGERAGVLTTQLLAFQRPMEEARVSEMDESLKTAVAECARRSGENARRRAMLAADGLLPKPLAHHTLGPSGTRKLLRLVKHLAHLCGKLTG